MPVLWFKFYREKVPGKFISLLILFFPLTRLLTLSLVRVFSYTFPFFHASSLERFRFENFFLLLGLSR